MILFVPFFANGQEYSEVFSFTELFAELKKLQELDAPLKNNHLIIDELLDERKLAALVQFVQDSNEAGLALPFTRISVKADLNLLAQPQYHALIEAFNHSTLQSHDLLVTEELAANPQALTNALMTHIAPRAAFPLRIDTGKIDTQYTKVLTPFYQNTIENIQNRHATRDSRQKTRPNVFGNNARQTFEQSKPLALKALVLGKDVNMPSVKLEVQHIEVVDAVQEKALEIEIVQQHIQQTNQEAAVYQGTLLGRQEFFSDPGINHLLAANDHANAAQILKQEFFGNTAYGIKFMTPEAAQEVAKQCTALASLNPSNLPPHFVLKKTPTGEGVLDYNAFADDEPNNVFTPRAYAHYEEKEYLYPLELVPKAVAKNPRMVNLWIRYGDAGVTKFNAALVLFKQAAPELAKVLEEQFLANFNHFDHFMDNDAFSKNLEKMAAYQPLKRQWLSIFLRTTGTSKHDLTLTLNAFDSFWERLHFLCNRAGCAIPPAPWLTLPKGGNPVVYMERLLTILENTRDLREQFSNLNSIDLGYYGPYYAVKNEGFLLVAPEMELHCDHEQQDKKVFNSQTNLYRETLDSWYGNIYQLSCGLICTSHDPTHMPPEQLKALLNYNDAFVLFEKKLYLVEFSENKLRIIPMIANPEKKSDIDAIAGIFPKVRDQFVWATLEEEDKISAQFLLTESVQESDISGKPIPQPFFNEIQACRYIGIQKDGIKMQVWSQTFKKLLANYLLRPPASYLCEPILLSLLFTTHERYQHGQNEEHALHDLFNRSQHINSLYQGLLKRLIQLAYRDIKLDVNEGKVFVEQWIGLNSFEFERFHFAKDALIERLIEQLHTNKFAMQKTLSWIDKHGSFKLPMNFALDTADFLAQEPLIAATFRESLLLFSMRINSDVTEAFYEDREKNLAAEKLDVTFKQQKSFDMIVRAARKKARKRAGLPDNSDDNDSVDLTEEWENAKQIRSNMNAVKSYLLNAAKSGQENNSAFACHIIMAGKEKFTAARFLEAMREIDMLPDFNPDEVKSVLKKHKLDYEYNAPIFILRDNQELKSLLILFISEMNAFNAKTPIDPDDQSKEDLFRLTINELQEIFNQTWKTCGAQYVLGAGVALQHLLSRLKEAQISQAYETMPESHLKKVIQKKILHLKGFSDNSNFEQVSQVVEMVNSIVGVLTEILKQEQNAEDLAALIQDADLSLFDYDVFYNLISLLREMPQRNSQELMSYIVKNHWAGEQGKNKTLARLALVRELHLYAFPSYYIQRLMVMHDEVQKTKEFSVLKHHAISMFQRDPDDKLLKFLLEDRHLSIDSLCQLLRLIEPLGAGHVALEALFTMLANTSPQATHLFAQSLFKIPERSRGHVLEIVAKCVAITPGAQLRASAIDYSILLTQMHSLSDDKIVQLHEFIKTTTPSIPCLQEGLAQYNPAEPFADFLLGFEKAPFGARNTAIQFDTSQVERVVNTSQDLLNKSRYPIQYRKQWMEAFLFVNRIGHDLPIYDGKPVCQLSNEQIKTAFQAIKKGHFNHLGPFNKRLLALALIREAAYRTTGQFPYSTQILSLIDCMMHEGDVISNIDTGEGKSLIDAMKAALLWIDSDRVEVSTSSIVDARRDIQIYSPFFNLLDIAHSNQPIDSESSFDAFQKKGINYSTFAQLALFFAKADVHGVSLEHPNDKLSIVVNESDFSLLEDKTIYRSALRNQGAGVGQEWIYYAINRFVRSDWFIESARRNSGKEEDIAVLREYLKEQARIEQKSPKIVARFDNEQLRTWIESAILVNYKLREHHDYVIPDELVTTHCHGVPEASRAVKLLMQDGKVSPDTQLGNGAQQLLYAELNHERDTKEFIIEPESRTITASNNKNMIARYQRKKGGFVWGDSATVGSTKERREQFIKYGFSFSGIAPHKKRRDIHHNPIKTTSDAAQIAYITRVLQQDSIQPKLLFCKDIETAKRLFEALKHVHQPCQLFTGLGDEVAVIDQAKKPNMLTITTSALGRNTNIHYDPAHGMTVIHTSRDSIRHMKQKSGRTGRQGSPGNVYYCFQDNDNDSVDTKTVAQSIEAREQQERLFQEELYDVMDLLYQEIMALDDAAFKKHSRAAFLQSTWGPFSDKIEMMYRERKFNNTWDKQLFIRDTLDAFDKMLVEELKNSAVVPHDQERFEQLLAGTFELPSVYLAADKNIHMKDCIPAELIALSFIAPQTKNWTTIIDAALIKNQVQALLANPDLAAANANYINYLQRNTPALLLIREAHQSVLSDWMKQESMQSQRMSFLDRWLGKSSTLAKKIGDQNWLLMFRTLVVMTKSSREDEEVVVVDDMKTVITALLIEYVNTSWFVNSARKAEVSRLQERIAQCTNATEIMQALAQSKIQTIRHDKNATGFFSRQNRSGNSRFQDKLDAALNLASTLDAPAAHEQQNALIKEMVTEWNDLTGAKQQLPTNTSITSDHLLSMANNITTKNSAQKGNAEVLANSMMSAIGNKAAGTTPEGMLEKEARSTKRKP